VWCTLQRDSSPPSACTSGGAPFRHCWWCARVCLTASIGCTFSRAVAVPCRWRPRQRCWHSKTQRRRRRHVGRHCRRRWRPTPRCARTRWRERQWTATCSRCGCVLWVCSVGVFCGCVLWVCGGCVLSAVARLMPNSVRAVHRDADGTTHAGAVHDQGHGTIRHHRHVNVHHRWCRSVDYRWESAACRDWRVTSVTPRVVICACCRVGMSRMRMSWCMTCRTLLRIWCRHREWIRHRLSA
jgi:hypothetical protein